MSVFKLNPEPTFKCKVLIPRAGKIDGEITLNFQYFPLDELAIIEKEIEGKPVIDLMSKLVIGWDLPDDFNEENLVMLLRNYPASASAIIKTYYQELMGNREKN